MKRPRKYTPDEDAPLLASWQRGEISSFETLLWKYLQRIYNLAHLLSGDPDIAAEAVQRVFVTACREIATLRSTARFATWLAGLTVRETRMLLDLKESPNPLSSIDAAAIEEGINPANGRQTSIKGDLRRHIGALPQQLGEVVVLHYVRGYSLERMAEILQLSVDSLISRLLEAQDILTANMKQAVGTNRSNGSIKSDELPPHAEIRRFLPIYLENTASAAEKNQLRKHLGGCGSCREALAELEWLVENLKSIPELEPPHWLAAAIMAKITTAGAPEPTREGKSLSPRLVPLLLVVFLLLGISWYLFQQRGDSNGPAGSPEETATSTPPPTASEERGPLYRTSPPSGSPAFTPEGDASPRSPALRLRSLAPPVLPVPPSPAAGTENPPQSRPKSPAPAESLKPEMTGKIPGGEITSELPSDWGAPPPPGRMMPGKKADKQSSREGVEILLGIESTAEPLEAIELAINGAGGEITGRAYSNGHDILYTRINAAAVYDLVKRLGRIGKILELPQIPEEAAGSIDLLVRW